MVRSIILQKQDRGEADELVLFFSRELGRLRGIAKNAKRSRVRFGGHLEPFSLADLALRDRRRDNLVWIDEAQALDGFLGIRNDIAKVASVSYFLEMVSLLAPEDSPDPALFDFLLAFLRRMDVSTPPPALMILDEISLLGILGYEPSLELCPVCGAVIEPGIEAVFSLEHGGAIHSTCSGKAPAELKISPDTLALVREGLKMDREVAARLKMSKRGALELRSALSSFVRYLRGGELNSFVFSHKMNSWAQRSGR